MLRLIVLVLMFFNEQAFGAPGSYSGNIDAIDPDSTYGDGNIFAGAILLLLIYGVFKFAHSLGRVNNQASQRKAHTRLSMEK